jgi:hypothetical protein
MPAVDPMYVAGMRDEHVRAARRLVFTFECELPTYMGASSVALLYQVLQDLGAGARAASERVGAGGKQVGMQVQLYDAQERPLL